MWLSIKTISTAKIDNLITHVIIFEVNTNYKNNSVVNFILSIPT